MMLHKIGTSCFTLFCLVNNVWTSPLVNYQAATNTIDQLTNPKNYDNRLRPSFGEKKLNVTIYASIMTLGPISEINMEYSMDLILHQKWTDERLQNNLTYNIVLQGDKKNIIWLPDTFFRNVKLAHFHKIPSDESKVEILPDGKVRYTARIAVVASCDMDLIMYPLDKQVCRLTVQSFSYTVNELEYFWEEKEMKIVRSDMTEFSMDGDVLESRTVINDTYTNETFSALVATFNFKRGLEYSFIQIYAPTCLIVILSWLNFWIPLEAVPARTALGITTVLTIVTLMGSIRIYVPKVSYIKAIDIYLIVSFAFVFASILEFVCATLHDGMKKKKRMRTAVSPAPDEDKEFGSKSSVSSSHSSFSIREKGETKEHGNDSDESDLGAAKYDDLMKKQFENVGFLLKSLHSNVRSKTNTMKDAVLYAYIKNDADIIDRMSRVFFPIFYAGFNAVYWTVYLGPWDIIQD